MLGSSEAIIVVVLIMLLFGGAQIPKLARNLGLAQKELKDALKGDDEAAAQAHPVDSSSS